MSSGGSGGSMTDPCSRFEFVASGLECPSSGCPSVSCGCEGAGFPVSITECTPDGCLAAANCEMMCAEELDDIYECTGSYTIAPGGSGGSSGSGGTPPTGGTGGTGGATAMCAPDDVAVPVGSASLATTLVTVVRPWCVVGRTRAGTCTSRVRLRPLRSPTSVAVRCRTPALCFW